MADFVATYLDSGRAKRAQDFGAGLNTPIVSVEYGMGNRVADGSETALVTPFNPPIVFAMPPGLVSGETIQTTVNIPEAFRAPNSIDIHEAIYKTTDGTPIFYATRETGAMFTKPGNTGLIVPLVMTFGGDNLTGFTFNSLPVAIADESTAGIVQIATRAEAEATAGHSPNKVLSALRGWQQAVVYLASRKADNLTLDTGTDDTRWASVAGIVRMIQRFVPKATKAQYRARAPNSVFLTPDSIPESISQVFTGSGTWTKPAGAKVVIVEVIGGGAGGSRSTRAGLTAGIYDTRVYLASALPASVAITVAGGGAGRSNAAASNGGTSRFGNLLSAAGGRGVSGDAVTGDVRQLAQGLPGFGGMTSGDRGGPAGNGIGAGGAFGNNANGGNGGVPGGSGGNSSNRTGGNGGRGEVRVHSIL